MSPGERRAVPTGLWLTLAVVAVATVIAEVFVHHHAHFGIDGSFAFYGWYTVICAVAGVLVARIVGAILGRREGYYD